MRHGFFIVSLSFLFNSYFPSLNTSSILREVDTNVCFASRKCDAKLPQMFRCSKHINYLYTSISFHGRNLPDVSFFTKNRKKLLNQESPNCSIFAPSLRKCQTNVR